MRPNRNVTQAVILVNLGTPDAATAPAVRRYLREFLSDQRVIEIPRIIWQVILNLFVLPLRPKRVARAYASVWQTDSPMRETLYAQVEGVQAQLDAQIQAGALSSNVIVRAAMSYGNPALATVLSEVCAAGASSVVVLPLFPQYSATSTGAVYDAVTRWVRETRNLPSIAIVKDYFAHPAYIAALADSVRRYQAEHGKADKLLFSFHGIPQPYADKGDPYPARCKCTAAQVAAALGLRDDEWLTSFQSRFGKQEWVKPYTDVVLTEWAQSGVGSVQVISPAFSADCLETLEELAIENNHRFIAAGGKQYAYIPALNADAAHVALFADLVTPLLQGFVHY